MTKHKFTYTQEEENADLEFPNQKVEVEIDGMANLTAMFRNFQGYLVASGFVLPDNMQVGLTPIDHIPSLAHELNDIEITEVPV